MKKPEICIESAARESKIMELLKSEHSDAKIALNFSNPLELLVATILSAQCTDERVNAVTKTLFSKYAKAEDYAQADVNELQQDIRSTGFYRNKAKNIMKCCQIIVEKYNSQVPKKMEQLLELPGVARKTANIVLSNAYGIVVGIAVDTHVRRLSQRLGLTSRNDPDKIEKDLMCLFPQKEWVSVTDLLIFHGRRVCFSRKPSCNKCVVNGLCPSAFSFN